MTSPKTANTTRQRAASRRVLSPTKKIITSFIILLTGAGVSAVFWQIPAKGTGAYDICDQSVVDQQLVAVPLPREAESAADGTGIEQMSLPLLDQDLTADSGSGKYAQAYPTPEPVAARILSQQESEGTAETEELKEESFPVISKTVEPVREMIAEKPIAAEKIDKSFAEKPKNTFNTSDVDDKMSSLFQFAENINAENAGGAKTVPDDPFPVISGNTSTSLKPLEKTRKVRLSPLQPL